MQWTRAFPISDLPIGAAKLFTRGREQVAVFRPEGDDIFAIDNRCPHEGYPLIQGSRDGCTLTCCFHNFKFDLRTGACLKGDEAVRTYPVRVTGEAVELDLTPPDPTEAIPGYWASMAEGLLEHRVGQAVRDAVRLLTAGVEPAELTGFIAAWDGARAQYGATHVLAVAWDVLQWQDRYPGPRFAVPLAQLIELCARGCVRRPERPRAAPIDPGRHAPDAFATFRRAVEAEDAEQAEGLLLGALERGWRRRELEPWFFHLCADHFLSFGHRLIYQTKVFDLLDACGWQHAPDILRGHLYGILCGTREDVLPAWAGFRRRLAALDLAALHRIEATWDDEETTIHAVVSGSPAACFAAITAALKGGAQPDQLARILSLAAAERMLRFDVAIDSDPGNQDSWLSVTHIQTFASAVRYAMAHFDHPDVLKLVYYAARFANHHRVLDGQPEALTPAETADVDAAIAAILAGQTGEALARTAAILQDPEQTQALRAALMDVAISDRFSAPIVSAHAMKNLIVAFEESEALRDPRPVLALVRLLSSPLQQRWTHRGALEAVAFVTEGRIPKLLAP